MTAPFRKVLVANRGEIAIRIFRALRELGSLGGGVLRGRPRALHLRRADEAHLIGAGAPAESYLNVARVSRPRVRAGPRRPPRVRVPRRKRGVRPRVEEAGLVWIGPPP